MYDFAHRENKTMQVLRSTKTFAFMIGVISCVYEKRVLMLIFIDVW